MTVNLNFSLFVFRVYLPSGSRYWCFTERLFLSQVCMLDHSSGNSTKSLRRAVRDVYAAALDGTRVTGLTHQFYRYPARFSPLFARAAISEFSKPGDLVLDPFMGGGTSVVESVCLGRRAIGSDVNSLSVFVAGVKTTPLTTKETAALTMWGNKVVPHLRCHQSLDTDPQTAFDRRTFNLTLPKARHLKKMLSILLQSLRELPTRKSNNFARCVLLNVGQWALNGRRRIPTSAEFRGRVSSTLLDMIDGIGDFSATYHKAGKPHSVFLQEKASCLPQSLSISKTGLADLIVCSPPYPGIHMLYHRWQVDGRKETPAPYWIADCQDGDGPAFYCFSGRRAEDLYFERLLESLQGIRAVSKKGAFFVQLVSFAEPRKQLNRYLMSMKQAGFQELRRDTDLGYSAHRRMWRSVPGRKWHANMKGDLKSSREVLLVHRAA